MRRAVRRLAWRSSRATSICVNDMNETQCYKRVDEERFRRTKHLIALEVTKQSTQRIVQQLNGYLLTLSGIKPVVSSPHSDQLRRVLLDETHCSNRSALVSASLASQPWWRRKP